MADLDPARASLVMQEYRYATVEDATIKAKFPGANEIVIETGLDAVGGSALALSTFALAKDYARVFTVDVEGVLFLEDFTTSPNCYSVDFGKRHPAALTGTSYSLIAAKVDYLNNRTTLTVRSGRATGDVSFNFAGGTMPNGASIARASTGTRIGSDGLVKTEANDVARFDYDLSTARYNFNANSEFVGATVSGTVPNLIRPTGNGTTSIGSQVVAVGKDANGVSYVDLRIYGQNTGTGTAYPYIYFGNASTIAGETLTGSADVSIVAGSTAGLNTGQPAVGLRYTINSTGAYVGEFATTVTTGPTVMTHATPATADIASHYVQLTAIAGASIDITLRLKTPQLERSATVTAYIPTTGKARAVIDAATGLLVERRATNYCATSNGTSLTRLTRTTGIDDPAGGTDAARYAVTDANDPSAGVIANVAPSGKTLTKSAYLRNATMNGQANKAYLFDYGTTGTETPSAVTVSPSPVWGRYTGTRTFNTGLNSTTTTVRIDPFDGTGGTNTPVVGSSMDSAFWQYEDGAVATSYILPGQTRAADILCLDLSAQGSFNRDFVVTLTFANNSTQTLTCNFANSLTYISGDTLNNGTVKSVIVKNVPGASLGA